MTGAPAAGTDAYEFRDGRLLLLTDGLTNWPIGASGTAAQAPAIVGVTPSGHDVLFIAAAQYTPDALDRYTRVYDARIGGGFEFPPPPKPCPLEVCQGIPKGAPEEALPGTATLAGAGNAQAKKHVKKRHKKHKKKQTRKHRRHSKADSKGGRGR